MSVAKSVRLIRLTESRTPYAVEPTYVVKKQVLVSVGIGIDYAMKLSPRSHRKDKWTVSIDQVKVAPLNVALKIVGGA